MKGRLIGLGIMKASFIGWALCGVGCGSSAPPTLMNTTPDAPARESDGAAAPEDAAASCVPDQYPDGPYRASVGSVIANLDFVGRVSLDPMAGPASSFPWKPLTLDDVRRTCKPWALVFVPAYWCGPCRANAKMLAEQTQSINDAGGVVIEILVDGSPAGTPPTQQMLDSFVSTSGVNFTSVIDPPDKPLRTLDLLGFDAAYVVELATMTIAYKGPPANAVTFIKQKLSGS